MQSVLSEKRAAGPARASKLDRFRPVIDAILEADMTTHRKQRHTAWRIYERLKAERGHDGGYRRCGSVPSTN
ncbi:hypothetical protein GC163_10115 [bacterium]|nr:hypothetical protein [bacterium]